MVLNVGAFANEDVCVTLNKLANIRDEVLRRCYEIEGYKDLPLDEKSRIYDRIKQEVMR